jgi:predicted permease
MNTLLQDIRYALRQLRKSPAFTLTVIVTLALGIGANAAIFTLFDQVLLRMLPVERPQELVRFEWTGSFSGSASSFGGDPHNYFSYPMYKDLRDHNQVFSDVIAADRAQTGVSWHNQAENKETEIVSGNYFQMFGLKPAVGRLLTPQDDTARNANPVAVLSYDYWKARFAASPDVVGQTLLINGHPFTILGVAPKNFSSAIGGYRPGVFIPISMVDVAIPWAVTGHRLDNHQSIWLTLVARLKPGVPISQAEASLGPLWHSLRAYELTLYKSRSERFKKGFLDNSQLKVKDDSTGFSPGRMQLKTPLVILMSMAGLLVALCAINVATLLLLRASGRAREMSMRYALGAKRSRIISQLLVEGGLLGIAGAAAGLALAPLDDQCRPGQRALFHLDGCACPPVHAGAFDSRQPAFRHCASAPLHAARSRRFAAPELGHGIQAIAALPQDRRRRTNHPQCLIARRRRPIRPHPRQSSPSAGRLRDRKARHLQP